MLQLTPGMVSFMTSLYNKNIAILLIPIAVRCVPKEELISGYTHPNSFRDETSKTDKK